MQKYKLNQKINDKNEKWKKIKDNKNICIQNYISQILKINGLNY